MCNLSNIKQLTNNSELRLGGHGKQQLLFPLVRLILCYAIPADMKLCFQERP